MACSPISISYLLLSSFTKDQNEGVVGRFLATHNNAGSLKFAASEVGAMLINSLVEGVEGEG